MFVIWRGLGLENGMRKNEELERGQKRNRQDSKKEKLSEGFKAHKRRNFYGPDEESGSIRE